ncbi:MAG: C39 family peptidase [Leptospiraceae bacterium]|jgi:hypothetical protein|nr:C39 family peptidase [Leptospiraceae bacterium]
MKLQEIYIENQPDETTCGITCLQAVYRFYETDYPSLDQLKKEVEFLKEGGTLAVMLGNHALERGYSATIYTYNLQIFDPTWFLKKNVNLKEKLILQRKCKKEDSKLVQATDAYLKFIKWGGKIKYEDLTPKLLRKIFQRGVPIITGLSSTYLYNSMRERSPTPTTVIDDDICGEPAGHFVVLVGYDSKNKKIIVKDPYPLHPGKKNITYKVRVGRLINSILLGIVTFDANLLVIEK